MTVNYRGSREWVRGIVNKMGNDVPVTVFDAVTLNREQFEQAVKSFKPRDEERAVVLSPLTWVRENCGYSRWVHQMHNLISEQTSTQRIYAARTPYDWWDDIVQALEHGAFCIQGPARELLGVSSESFESFLVAELNCGAQNADVSMPHCSIELMQLANHLPLEISIEVIPRDDLIRALQEASVSSAVAERIVEAQELNTASETGRTSGFESSDVWFAEFSALIRTCGLSTDN